MSEELKETSRTVRVESFVDEVLIQVSQWPAPLTTAAVVAWSVGCVALGALVF